MKRVYLVILVLPLLLSCNSNNCKQLCSEKGLSEDCCPKIDSSYVELSKPRVNCINIFIETSGSMAGYMPAAQPSTKFQMLIPDIISKLNSKYASNVHVFYINEYNKPLIRVDFSKAKDDILGGKFNWAGNTYIPTMLDSINNYLNDSTVNVLVSDLIYSPEKSNSKITDIAATDIYTLANQMKDYSTSFICLFSEYRSSNCSNKILTEKSPYYLFLQGKPENIQIVEKIIHSSINITNNEHKEINFGIQNNKPFYSILPYTETTGNFIAYSSSSFDNGYVSIQDINLTDGVSKIEFWLGLDLNEFPEYVKSTHYLKQNLQIQIDNGIYEIIAIDTVPYSKVKIDDDDKGIVQRCTHIIKFKITGMTDCVSILTTSLKCSIPEWKDTINENTSQNNREKTFGFKKIISGFEQVYIPSGNEYFFKELKISLIKE